MEPITEAGYRAGLMDCGGLSPKGYIHTTAQLLHVDGSGKITKEGMERLSQNARKATVRGTYKGMQKQDLKNDKVSRYANEEGGPSPRVPVLDRELQGTDC